MLALGIFADTSARQSLRFLLRLLASSWLLAVTLLCSIGSSFRLSKIIKHVLNYSVTLVGFPVADNDRAAHTVSNLRTVVEKVPVA